MYQYDPYGQVTLGSTEHTDFYGYNAESYNPNTGLEFLRARYYNANQGRFFQEDTYLGDITDPLTLNRYAYTKNSPLNYIDPSGHSSYGIGAPQNLTDPHAPTNPSTPSPSISVEITDRQEYKNQYLSERDEQILSHQGETQERKSGESYFDWKIRLAEMSGTHALCVRDITRAFLEKKV